jgi:hypothetical protein
VPPRVGGIDGRGGVGANLSRLSDLLEDEIIADLVEGGERDRSRDLGPHVIITLIEAP